jgi:heptaprenylglyceryl phosphate synthase
MNNLETFYNLMNEKIATAYLIVGLAMVTTAIVAGTKIDSTHGKYFSKTPINPERATLSKLE